MLEYYDFEARKWFVIVSYSITTNNTNQSYITDTDQEYKNSVSENNREEEPKNNKKYKTYKNELQRKIRFFEKNKRII